MVKMTLLNSREEWLEHRKKGIGGSEISAVIGANPYMSNTELWELKTGRREPDDISDNPFVRYGTLAEEYIRKMFELRNPHLDVHYKENNSFRNDKYPFAQASVDGWIYDENKRLGIWECKTTEIMNRTMLDKWKDGIPQNYFCQVLLYMAVLEADFCVLTAEKRYPWKTGYAEVQDYYIERSEVQEDIEYLMAEGEKFWGYVQRDERPPCVLPNDF